MAYSNAGSGGTLIAGSRLQVVTAGISLPDDTKLSGPLTDRWGRTASDLRISLTDRCNLRCRYCMPAEGLDWLPSQRVLTADEIIRLSLIGIESLGIKEIRFTGGEPLLRRELPDIVAAIHTRHPYVPLSLTTNGLGLEKKADRLVEAGLTRINVSLDSICPETFAQLTRRDRLHSVLRGIDYAAAAGLTPVKVNAVLMPDINVSQAPELLQWALDSGYQLRFIEQMPLDADHRWSREKTVTAAEIRRLLSTRFRLNKPPGSRGSAPADLWEVYPAGTVDCRGSSPLGQVGIIASVTEPFCSRCTRTRLTADGKIRSCLFSQIETDLMQPLRSGATNAEIAMRWREAMWGKPAAHGKDSAGFSPTEFAVSHRSMSAIGG